MSSTITLGNISLSIFGESHGTAIGAVIDNLPAGEELDLDKIYEFMSRRASKKDGTSTMRSETDIPEIISGFYNGRPTGEALCTVIRNMKLNKLGARVTENSDSLTIEDVEKIHGGTCESRVDHRYLCPWQ